MMNTTIKALNITSRNNTSVVSGTNDTFRVTATGTTPIKYSLTGEPTGVSINSTSGLITIAGTTAVGTHSFLITASNGTFPDETQDFTLTIAAAVSKTLAKAISIDNPTFSFNNLNSQEQQTVTNLISTIDLSTPNTIIEYGSTVQAERTRFFAPLLSKIRTRDLGEIGQQITTLVADIEQADISYSEKIDLITDKTSKLKNSVKNLFKIVKKIKADYTGVDKNLNIIKTKLENHQKTLRSDIEMLEMMGKNTVDYANQIRLYIIAGKEALQQYKNINISAQHEKTQNTNDIEDRLILKTMISNADKFEIRLINLIATRQASIYVAMQIKTIQEANYELTASIQSTIYNGLPLITEQMSLTVGLLNSQAAHMWQKKVKNSINRLIIANSARVKELSIEIARESKDYTVSVESLKKVHEDIRSMLQDIANLCEESRSRRITDVNELLKLENESKQAAFYLK